LQEVHCEGEGPKQFSHDEWHRLQVPELLKYP
jgi:hypothetical protein